MRHRKQGRKLGRTPAHRRAMLRNLVCNLFLLDPEEDRPRRVTTTIPKAKEARRLAERAITLGKEATLHARRRALALLQNKRAVKRLFEDIAPLYNGRDGGYTRILRLAKSRRGDGTDLCYFELVSEPVEVATKPDEPGAPRRVTTTPAEEPASEEAEEALEEPAEEPTSAQAADDQAEEQHDSDDEQAPEAPKESPS